MSAAERVDTLEQQLAEAQAQHDRDEADRAAEAYEAQFAGISNLRVTEGHTDAPEGLLGKPFIITWTAPVWNPYLAQSEPGEHSVNGFQGLPENVLLYLIEKAPEQIPAAIRALAPGDPGEALGRYFLGRNRGHL